MTDIVTSIALTAQDFATPAVSLSGTVDYGMYNLFRQQMAQSEGPLVIIELTTLGGDPEVARMMGEDVRYRSDLNPERRFVFLGKAAVYSAGATFMSFFARENRYLTRGTRLMVHERSIKKTLNLEGPLTSCVASVKAALNEIEASIRIQNEGFENLVRGSDVTFDDMLSQVSANWYLDADEAAGLRLIQDVL